MNAINGHTGWNETDFLADDDDNEDGGSGRRLSKDGESGGTSPSRPAREKDADEKSMEGEVEKQCSEEVALDGSGMLCSVGGMDKCEGGDVNKA